MKFKIQIIILAALIILSGTIAEFGKRYAKYQWPFELKGIGGIQEKPAIETAGTKEVQVDPGGAETVSAGTKKTEEEQTAIAGAGLGFLPFTTLMMWDYDPAKKEDMPVFLRSVHGADVKIMGFMYPLEQGEMIKNFCLLRSTQTCCYGAKPQYNQYVFVEMEEPVKFEREASVIVSGNFFVHPKPAEGFIYRMRGVSVEKVGKDDFKDDASNAADASKFEEFKIEEVEKFFEKVKEKNIGDLTDADFAEILKYDGRTVVIKGFFTGILSRTNPKILVGKYYWDGCCQGTPPGLNNSMPVKLKNGQNIPKFWDNKAAYAGKIKVNRDAAKWPYAGVAAMEEAERAK